MRSMDFKGRWVLVTGASSGLGKEITRLFALEHGANVILVARRVDRLRDLARALEKDAGVQVRVIEADLSREADVERVYAEAIDHGEIYGVVLNAGVTYFGEHANLAWSEFSAMLATNVTSVVRLTSLFVPYLIARGREGGVLLVTSMGGLMPVPYQSAYSGTKGFLVNFGRALWHELQGSPVSITTFAPGGITTELTHNAGLSRHFKSTLTMMTPEACARLAIRGFARRRYLHIPGLLNKLAALLIRILPQRLFVAAVGAEYKKALRALEAPATREPAS